MEPLLFRNIMGFFVERFAFPSFNQEIPYPAKMIDMRLKFKGFLFPVYHHTTIGTWSQKRCSHLRESLAYILQKRKCLLQSYGRWRITIIGVPIALEFRKFL